MLDYALYRSKDRIRHQHLLLVAVYSLIQYSIGPLPAPAALVSRISTFRHACKQLQVIRAIIGQAVDGSVQIIPPLFPIGLEMHGTGVLAQPDNNQVGHRVQTSLSWVIAHR